MTTETDSVKALVDRVRAFVLNCLTYGDLTQRVSDSIGELESINTVSEYVDAVREVVRKNTDDTTPYVGRMLELLFENHVRMQHDGNDG